MGNKGESGSPEGGRNPEATGVAALQAAAAEARTDPGWSLEPEAAVRLQTTLAGRVIRDNRLGTVQRVAGVDVGLPGNRARAAVVVLDYPSLDPVDFATAEGPVPYPYVPGLLSFREGPVILAAMEKLSAAPDLFIFDGQGIAHPRRLGIASHIGVLIDWPTIGCAKSRLCGRHGPVPPSPGEYAPLLHEGETVGAVLRTRRGVKPVFVSPGHRVDLTAGIAWVLACCRGYKLPETTRWAHQVAGGGTPPIQV